MSAPIASYSEVVRQQRTERGKKFENWRKALSKASNDLRTALHEVSDDEQLEEETLEELRQYNIELKDIAAAVQRKDLKPGDVHVPEVLTSMSVMYHNDEFIGLRVMPQFFTGKNTAKFYKYGQSDRFDYPDDTMSTRTTPNELNQTREKVDISLVGRALQESIDAITLREQDQPLNELMDLQDNVLNGLAFRQELRIITAATTAGNFSGNTVALAAGDRWSNGGGDPGAVVDTGTSALWKGNSGSMIVGACSLNVYNALRRHQKVLDTFKYGGSQAKFATVQMLQEFFELDMLLVGRARKNSAAEGASASYTRMWPDVFGIYVVHPTPTTRSVHFGTTFQDTQPVSQLIVDEKYGMQGGLIQKDSFHDSQQVISGISGYLVTTPI